MSELDYKTTACSMKTVTTITIPLSNVEKEMNAKQLLRSLGYTDINVIHHDMSSGTCMTVYTAQVKGRKTTEVNV